MSMFSRIISSQINWDKADTEQKLAALAELPPNDPLLEQLALHDSDERVRHKAIERMEGEVQLRLIGAIQSADETFLAACLGERLDDSAVTSGDLVAQLVAAPASFRVALIAQAKSEPLAIALTETLDQDGDRAQVARGKGAIDARAAATRVICDIELLEALAHEYRDKQRRIYRAARDRADQLLAAREVRRHALEVCERLEGLLARHELTLTLFTNAEREWVTVSSSPVPSPSPAQASEELAALQVRYAGLKEQARALMQEQGEIWRDAERLKVALTELAARSETDESVEPEALEALVATREAAAAKIALAAFAALPKERNHLLEAIGKLTERHAILAIESKALVTARRLVAELSADPAVLTPAWRTEFARSVAIVRPVLRAPIEEAATAARATIDAATRQLIEAQRAVEQQFRAEIEALVKQLEHLLDKGQHQQANDAANVLKEKRGETPGTRPLPAALEFRLKRCQDRLAKMNEWKRFGDVQAREALCREAEALVKRVARQEKSQLRKEKPEDFPWPVSTPQPAQVVDEVAPHPETAAADELSEPKAADTGAQETPEALDIGTDTDEAVPAKPADTAAQETPEALDIGADTDEAVPAKPADTAAQETPEALDIGADTETKTTEAVPAKPASTVVPVEAKTATAHDDPDLPALKPEDLAQAVRDLQARWQKLDKGQGASSKGLWERFRRACDRAYAPAKKHFEELEQHRSENAERKNAVLDKIAALNERIVDGAEWGKVLNLRGELVKAWFEAGALPRKDARAMQKRFDALTAEIDAKLDARRVAERARRRALIDQAKAIAERPADGGSMAAMIALQKQWQDSIKGAIRLKAKEDQAIWEEFRAAGSALFGKRDAEKAARNSERDVQLTSRRTLVDELQALTSGSDATAVKRGIDELSARWHAMEWPDRKPLRDWEQKFSSARAAAIARIAAIRSEAENQQRAVAAARLAVVERAERVLGDGSTPDMDAVRAELQGMLAEGEKLDTRVVSRLAALEAAVKIGPDAWRAQAQKTQGERDALLLELEIVLGLPSPPELEAERRMRMLKRLAESKNSRLTPPLMAPDAPKAVEKLLALPLAMQGAQARVEAVIEAVRRKGK